LCRFHRDGIGGTGSARRRDYDRLRPGSDARGHLDIDLPGADEIDKRGLSRHGDGGPPESCRRLVAIEIRTAPGLRACGGEIHTEDLDPGGGRDGLECPVVAGGDHAGRCDGRSGVEGARDRSGDRGVRRLPYLPDSASANSSARGNGENEIEVGKTVERDGGAVIFHQRDRQRKVTRCLSGKQVTAWGGNRDQWKRAVAGVTDHKTVIASPAEAGECAR